MRLIVEADGGSGGYRVLIASLRAAQELDATDSKLVVEQMSGRWKVKHPAAPPVLG